MKWEHIAQQYQEQGFAHVPCVFSLEEVSQLAKDLDKASHDLPDVGWSGGWRDAYKADGYALISTHDIHQASPAWLAAVDQPLLREIVTALLGAHRLEMSTIVTKPPKVGQPFPLHQDCVYHDPKDRPYVMVTLYLDDTSHENGPIRFLPNSHLRGALEHVTQNGGKRFLHTEHYRIEDTVDVGAKAGDISIFGPFTVHGSYPNVTEAPRRTVRLMYRCL